MASDSQVDFRRALSAERFLPYQQESSNDAHAWALYRWNLELVAVLGPLLCDFEVTLRNTIHSELSEKFKRSDWWTSSGLCLAKETQQLFEPVIRKHHKQLTKGTVGPGRVIADLTLGAWVSLLSAGGKSVIGQPADYEAKLWRPAVRLGFQTGEKTRKGRMRRPTRKEVHRRASNVQQLRNAAAHHRRISNGIRRAGTGENEKRLPLEEVHRDTIEMLRWICPSIAEIHESSNDFADLLNARPAV